MSGAGGRAQRPAADPAVEGAVRRREVGRAGGLAISFLAAALLAGQGGSPGGGWGALPDSPVVNTGVSQ